MIYEGPGFLAVVWFGSSPTPLASSPVGKLFLFLTLGEGSGRGAKSYDREKLWHQYISFNTLWLELTTHGSNIFKDIKPYLLAFLKNWPVKVLGGRCLSVCGPRSPPPPLHIVWIHTPVLIHTGKGGKGNQWEGYRGANHKRGWLTVSPVYKL